MTDEQQKGADNMIERVAEIEGRLDEIGGCGDSSCLVAQPVGMCTNGGCRCVGNRIKMQRVLHSYLEFTKAIKAALEAGE